MRSADTERELITEREASNARSKAGAKSTLKPSARQFSPITTPSYSSILAIYFVEEFKPFNRYASFTLNLFAHHAARGRT